MDKRHGHCGHHHHHHCKCRGWDYPVVMNCAMVASELDDMAKRSNELVMDAYEFQRSALVLCYRRTCKQMLYGMELTEKRMCIVKDTIEVLMLRLFALAKVVRSSCCKKLDIWYEGYSCYTISKKIEALGYEAEKIFLMVKALLRKVRKGEATPCYVAQYTGLVIEKGKELVDDTMELATEVKLSCRCASGCWKK